MKENLSNVFDLRNRRSALLVSLLLFVSVVWVFLPSLQGNFLVHDDYSFVNGNPHVNTGLKWENILWAFGDIGNGHWLPLTWLSHMTDTQVYGLNPWGHHLTNVLIHALNTVLVFLVFRKMTGAGWRSLMVAGLFGLHPLRVASVAWITERRDVLSILFWLLAMWTYARFAEESKAEHGKTKLFYSLTLLFFAMGLMSKATVVTLPCVFLLLDYWPLRRWERKNLWGLILEKIPFFALTVMASAAAYMAEKKGGAWQDVIKQPFSDHHGNALMSYVRYLGKFLWPENLCIYYPYSGPWPVIEVMAAGLFLIGVSVFVLMQWKRRPYLLVGWFWYLGTLVPMIELIQRALLSSGSSQSMADQYTYIPLIGVYFILVWGLWEMLSRWRYGPVVLSLAGAMALVACSAVTRHNIDFWKSDITVWNRAIVVTKNNFMAHYCLATSLPPTKPDEQFTELQKCLDIKPDFYYGQLILGRFLLAQSRYSDAIGHLEKAIQLEPQISWAYYDLGISFSKMGRPIDAIPPLMKSIEIEPQNVGYQDYLGGLLYSSNPEPGTVSNFLATARADPDGFGHFLEAVQFDTNHVVFINNLAWSFATFPDPKLRNGKYAIRLATRACEMTGFQSHSKILALAAAYAEDSRFDDAISSAQLAYSLASAAGQPELLKGDQILLELFRSHQPYHDSAKAGSP